VTHIRWQTEVAHHLSDHSLGAWGPGQVRHSDGCRTVNSKHPAAEGPIPIVRGGGRERQRTGAATVSCSDLPIGEQGDEFSRCLAEMVQNQIAFIGVGSRRITENPALCVGVDPERGQVAAIGCGVVTGLPALAHSGRVSREQDGSFEFTRVHVVVAGAARTGGVAGL
jgi:hypothetical protein